MYPLVPSDPETEPSNVIEVAYWLRIVLTATAAEPERRGRKYWTTHPLLLEQSSEAGAV